MGINTPLVMTFSFAMSAGIGALAGVLVTPITMTSCGVGLAFALKGFAAAMLGEMGNPKAHLSADSFWACRGPSSRPSSPGW